MPRSAKQWVSLLLLVLGIALAVVGVIYLTKGVRDLPGWLPGRPKYFNRLERLAAKNPKQNFNLDKKLTKRGIAVEVIALLCFVGAWYNSGLRKSPVTEPVVSAATASAPTPEVAPDATPDPSSDPSA